MLVGRLNDPFGGNKQNLDSIIMIHTPSEPNDYPVPSFSQRCRFS